MKPNNNCMKLLRDLEKHLVEVKEQNEWPSTTLGGGATAYVYYYRTTEDVKRILKESSRSFSDWLTPNLPEDIGFQKNGQMWMASCVHEEMFVLVTDTYEHIELLTSVKGLIRRSITNDLS